MSGLASNLRFEALGPLRAYADGRDVSISAARARVVLAMLLLHAGRTVPVDQLGEAVWSSNPPRSARNQVQTCVSQLRRQLAAPHQIVTEPSGYRLQVDPGHVDLYRFRTLVTAARAAVAAGRDSEGRTNYRAAVGLWRGPALSGVDSELVRDLAGAVDAEREQALEECLEVELALGGAGELVPELTELVRRYPYRERLHAALMRALYRGGRPADALAAFRRARQLFHDELGTEPGEELQRVHQAVLNRDAGLDPGKPVLAPPGLRELPVEASCFVGRDAEIVRVRGTLAPPDGQQRRRPPVVVLYGPGGTGKSALAVRVAHELVDQYPDGQLYVDLCGSTPGLGPLPAVEVLGRFLRRLGVHPSEVPSGRAEAAALFRSVTADRRLLLVLDNAADKEQVAELVPGVPSCGVLVTSRYPLPTLDVDNRLRIGALPDPDGLALLTGLTGRLATEPEAAGEIVALCGGLPLAIRVAAGRLASRPDLPGAEYAKRLADRSHRLDELQLDDLAVRASIRTSYDALLAGDDPTGRLAARTFRMLGLLHVPDCAPLVMAAMLTEPDVDTARAALDRLVDAQLVEAVDGGRYRLHDLVRLVAAECTSDEDTTSDRDDAITRAITFYTGSIWRAESKTRPSRVMPFGQPPVPESVQLPAFPDVSRAREWIDLELANLEAALAQAATMAGAAGRLSLWLSDPLWENLDTRCDWHAAFRVSQLTVEAGARRSDQELTALGLLLHGRSEACLGSYELAATYLQRGLDIVRELGNEAGAALALNGLGVIHERCGEPEAALSCYEDAIDLTTSQELVSLTASVLNNMVVSHTMLGQIDRAVIVGERSAALSRADADFTTHATAELNLSAVHCLRGDQVKALRCADRALSLSLEAKDRLRMCEELVIRSEINLRCGQRHEAYADADRARFLAEKYGYGYALAAAESQRSKICSALSRTAEAAHARVRAQETLGGLTRAYRDPMIELLLA